MKDAAVQHYLDTFARNACLREGAPWLHELRQEALARFAALGFPSTREEAWKYTSLHALQDQPFRLADKPEGGVGVPEIEDLEADTLLFVNGVLTGDPPDLPRGVHAQPLAGLLNDRPGELRELLHDREASPFTALNTAFLRDGLLLSLDRGAALERPLRLVFLSTAAGEPAMIHPRVILRLAEGASATVIEHYAGPGDAANFTNAVTRIELSRDAVLTHYRLQDEAPRQFHLGRLDALLAENSRLEAHNFMLGAGLGRLETHARLAAPGAECLLNGLSLAGDRQHHDSRLTVDHALPNARSVQNHRAVVANRARSVWNGKVLVREGADGTDAQQSCKNLLLDKLAEADAKPELEIYADEVKCSHGATVGQLDMDAFFYLRSRGIEENVARSLLVFAFADDVLARIGNRALRRHLEARVIERLPDNERIREFA